MQRFLRIDLSPVREAGDNVEVRIGGSIFFAEVDHEVTDEEILRTIASSFATDGQPVRQVEIRRLSPENAVLK